MTLTRQNGGWGPNVYRSRRCNLRIFRRIWGTCSIVGELFQFLWSRKLWWLLPILLVLLMFGVLMLFAESTAIGPFIYTLF
jgi:hypothetical protein